MNIMKKVIPLLAVMTLFMGTATIVTSVAGSVAPQEIVQTATENMQAALRENKAELDADSAKVYPLIKEHVLPVFDFKKMSQLALGKNWRKASDEQKVAFVEEFRLLLVRTYSTAMLEYAKDEIRFLPFKGDLAKKKVVVMTEVVTAGGVVPMSLSLFQNKAAAWKVYNIKIDGISLVTNYRTSFNSEIRKHGLDKLIADLASRNAKAKG